MSVGPVSARRGARDRRGAGTGRRRRARRVSIPGWQRLAAALAPRRRRFIAAAVVLLGLLAFGGWTWFRGSSLVAVDHVTISGVRGDDASAIRTALSAAARNMTTLDVQLARLRRAVAPFPEVQDLRVSAQFPHRLRIRVIERLPVAMIQVDGRQIPVAGDGTILRGLSVASQLPVLPVSVPPVGRSLTERPVAAEVSVLAAAPYRLLSRISQVSSVSGHGVVAQVRAGPSIYFGPATELALKWIAASEVLADPSSAGASYIDVTDPRHPAAGEGSGAGAASGSGAGAASGGTGSLTSGAATSSTSSGGSASSSSGGAAALSGASSSPSGTAAPGGSQAAATGVTGG